MSLELWSEILQCCVREGHYVDWAHFYGEPLLWKHFHEGMNMWRDSGLSRFGHLSTNGHLLTDDRIDTIASSGVREIRICVDSLRPDVYRRYRGNVDHAGLMAKTERFLSRAPHVHVELQLLVSPFNADESPRSLFERFGRFKNFHVFVSDLHNVGGLNSDLSERHNEAADPRRCNKVDYEHCIITWDGQIGLCCVDYALHNRLGDMSSGTIDGVYLGAYAEDVRRRIKSGDYSLAPYCKTCPMDFVGCRRRLVFAHDYYAVAKLRHVYWQAAGWMKKALRRES